MTTLMALFFLITVGGGFVRQVECRQSLGTKGHDSSRPSDCPADRIHKGSITVKTMQDVEKLQSYCAIEGYLTLRESEVQEITNSSLRHISGSLLIDRNSALTEVNLKSLQSLGGFFVWKNEKLRDLHVPSLEKVKGLFYVMDNPQLVVNDLKSSPADSHRLATFESESTQNWFAMSVGAVNHLGGWLVIKNNGSSGIKADLSKDVVTASE